MKILTVLFIGFAIGFTACNNNNQQQKTEAIGKHNGTTDTTQAIKPLNGKVELDNIPIQAKELIAKSYKGYTIAGASHDPLCSGGDAIDISLTKKGEPNYSLIFLLDGTFIQQEEDVNISEAPVNVLKTIKDKYSDYKTANQIERLILADKSVQYQLDISKGDVSKEVILKEDGTVICESKE